jgi:thiol-disulfide isomerase/thioredoxin
MAERRLLTRRGLALIGLALVAGAAAGLAAVYFRGGLPGNGADLASANCADVPAAAKALDPLIKGEVAAFRIADRPDSLADLAFKDPAGKETTLAAFAGRTVLVNLWATWCVPCRKEMPALDRLQGALGGDRFTVAAVNIDIGANGGERARAFLSEIGASGLAFYSDPTTAVFRSLKGRGLAFGLPTTVLVDGKGCRMGQIEGPAAWDSDDAKALIKAAIGAG